MRMTAKTYIRWVLISLLFAPSALAQKPELIVQTNHTSWIQSVAFSDDGKILATGDGNGTIKLWDVNTGRQIRTIIQHSTQFDPMDEKPFWTASKNMAVNLYERINGGGSANTIQSLSFSPDGKTLASGSTDRTIKLWDIDNIKTADDRAIPKIINTPIRVWFVAFDEEGNTLLSIGEDNSYRYWNLATLTEIKDNLPALSSFDIPWQGQHGEFTAEYSETQKTIKIVSSKTNVARIIGEHEAGVTRVIFSPNGKSLASCGWDRTVRLWDIVGNRSPKILGEHKSFVTYVAFSKDGKTLASVGGDLIVKLWDVESGKEKKSLTGYGSLVKPLLLVDDDGILITKSDNVVHLWDMKKGRKLKDLTLHRGDVNLAAFEPNKKIIATTDRTVNNLAQMAVCVDLMLKGYEKTNEIKVTPETEHCVLTRALAASRMSELSFKKWFSTSVIVKSSDALGSYDEFLISDNVIKLWNPLSDELKFLTGHTDVLSSLAFSKNGQLLASGDNEGTLKLWRIPDGTHVNTITAYDERAIKSIAFSPNGRKLATLDNRGILLIWSLIYVNNENVILQPHLPPIEVKVNRAFDVEGFTDGVFSVVGYDEKRQITVNSFDSNTGRITKDPAMEIEDEYALTRLRELTVSQFGRLFSSDLRFLFEYDANGKLGLFDRMNRQTSDSLKLLAWLIPLNKDDWVVVTPDGRFDTNKLENPEGLQWIFPDAPLTPLSFEIFMRDYYEPRLLSRLMRGEELPELPPIAELNRIQSKIENITVHPQPSRHDSVNVEVEVASVAGQCRKDSKYIPCESGIYNLRLYRDGQIVGQYPDPSADTSIVSPGGQDRAQQLQQWRQRNVVKAKNGRAVTTIMGKQTITFTDIRLPMRPSVSRVEFTAYAFNEDRVKSVTSSPVAYSLPKPRPNVKHRAYLISVGVDVTSDPNWRLAFAPNGAREVERLLREKFQSQYEVVSVPLISEYKAGSVDAPLDMATKGNIRTVLSILSGLDVTASQRQSIPNQDKLRAATPDDVVVLHVASHGYADPGGKFYVIPADIGEPAGISEELLNRCLGNSEQTGSCQAARKFLRRSISSDEMSQWLQDVDAGQMVLILDSCHSGAVSGPGFKPGPMGDRSFGQLAYDKGMLVLAATQGENVAWGTLELGDRSLLSYALVSQEPRSEENPFDLRDWLTWAEKRVPELYRKYAPRGAREEQEPALFDFSRRPTAQAGN